MLALNFTPFPDLITERLYLRQLTINDVKEIFMLRSDDDVNKYVGRKKATSIDEALQFIHKINNSITDNETIYWAISLKNEPQLIGTICYWNITKEDDTAEIGYELATARQGKGIMQEAITKVIDFGFEQMKLQTITAFPSADNSPSIRLLERNHFKRDEKKEAESREDLDNLIIYSLEKKSAAN